MADRRIYYKLNQAQHILSKRVDAELAGNLGIKTAQLGAVFFLLEHDGCMLKELSAGLGLNNSAITTLVVRMETGWSVAPGILFHRWAILPYIFNEKSKVHRQKAIPFGERIECKVSQGFSDEEIDTVIRFLDSITSIARGRMENGIRCVTALANMAGGGGNAKSINIQ